MKKATLMLFLFFCLVSGASAEWQQVNSPVDSWVYTIKFIDQNTGFLGTDSSIYKTTNGSVTWHQVYSGNLLAEKFEFAGDIGYAACFMNGVGAGRLLKTTNAGESWFETAATSTESFTDIYLFSSSELFISEFSGKIFYSSDGGASWVMDNTFGVMQLSGIGRVNQYMFANSAYFWLKRQDANSTWENTGYHGIFASSDFDIQPITNTIYIGGINRDFTKASISHSTNGGLNWSVQELSGEGFVRDIAFSYENGFAVGGNGNHPCIWKLVDTTWIIDTLLTDPLMINFQFFSISKAENDLYVAGSGGKIMKNSGILSGINSESIPSGYSLSQNYPNPFNPTTKISYSIPVNGIVTMSLFDVSGRKVQVLVNERKNAGDYSVEFNGSALTSGTYFYRIQAGEFLQTKKMLLIK